MATGKIKTLVRDRAFGFIQVDNGSPDVFFHSSSVADNGFEGLREGDSVQFDVEPDPRNPNRTRAANVRTTA